MIFENVGTLVCLYICDIDLKFSNESYYIPNPEDLTPQEVMAHFSRYRKEYVEQKKFDILWATSIVVPLRNPRALWSVKYNPLEEEIKEVLQ